MSAIHIIARWFAPALLLALCAGCAAPYGEHRLPRTYEQAVERSQPCSERERPDFNFEVGVYNRSYPGVSVADLVERVRKESQRQELDTVVLEPESGVILMDNGDRVHWQTGVGIYFKEAPEGMDVIFFVSVRQRAGDPMIKMASTFMVEGTFRRFSEAISGKREPVSDREYRLRDARRP